MQSAFITGASSGIGEALALELARRKANVTLVARRKDRLEDLMTRCERLGGSAIAVEGDVTVDGSLENAAKIARERYGRIDLVIANAGFSLPGKLERLTLEDYRRQFETNIFGVLRTIYATLPDLKASRGRIGVLGSVMSHVSLPGHSPYAMSKYALRALTEALVYELKPDGVSVTLLCPGFVKSEIRQEKDPIPDFLEVAAEPAAREILWAMEKRKKERVVTGHGKAIVFIDRHFHWLFELLKALT